MRNTTTTQPAPKHGPSIRIRFRTMADTNAIRRAARLRGMTTNTYAMTVLVAQARMALKG